MLLLLNSCTEAQTDNTSIQEFSETESSETITKKPVEFQDYILQLSQYVDTNYLNRFEREILKFEKKDSFNGYPTGVVLFTGSSSIRKWGNLSDDMKPATITNRGFGGSTMAELLYYFPRIIQKYQPRKIIIYEGDNDLSSGKMSPDTFIHVFNIFLDVCETYLPDAKLYFLSIKPSPARMHHWERMNSGNKMALKICNDNSNLEYIDVSSIMFSENGKIKTDIFLRDKLHMNRKGYELWKGIVREHIIEE